LYIKFLSSLVETLDVFWLSEKMLEKSTLSISFSVLSLHFFSQSHVSLCVLKHSQAAATSLHLFLGLLHGLGGSSKNWVVRPTFAVLNC